jgi:hypothetical protein
MGLLPVNEDGSGVTSRRRDNLLHERSTTEVAKQLPYRRQLGSYAGYWRNIAISLIEGCKCKRHSGWCENSQTGELRQDYYRLGGIKTEYYRLAARPLTRMRASRPAAARRRKGPGFVTFPDSKDDLQDPLPKTEVGRLLVKLQSSHREKQISREWNPLEMTSLWKRVNRTL